MHKEITIYDIAGKLNLPPATISRALKDHQAINKKTRKRIADMAEEMGYRSNHFASNTNIIVLRSALIVRSSSLKK